MGRNLFSDQGLQNIGQPGPLGPIAQDNMGYDDLSAHVIGFAHHRRHNHVGVTAERLLNLHRADTVSGSRDHIVVARVKDQLTIVT